MIDYTITERSKEYVSQNKSAYIDFIHNSLGRFTDTKESIAKCIEYYLKDSGGGYVFEVNSEENNKIIGLTIILKTHMDHFLPENFLVYIAVSEDARGKGIGGKIIDFAKEHISGGICLHVEPDNPALNLYKRKNFTNKYLEFRYEKS